jgi:hypothetical protein
MDMYDSLFSESCVLNEQIARLVFEVLSDDGPLVVILDCDGHCWPSDSERFGKLGISELFLRDLVAKIDDGTEPVVTTVDDCGIVAMQLATERTNCGYVMIVLPQYSPESTLANIGLIELALNQMRLIARLIEKNSQLYELQMKHFDAYGKPGASFN